MNMKKALFSLAALFLPCYAHTQIPFVSFEEGFSPLDFPSTDIGEIFKRCYDSYRKADHTEGEYLIPRIIHFVWLGSPLPEKTKKFVKTWEELHPDWTIRIWLDEDVPAFGLKNQAAFDRATNFGEKSDIFRYEILYRFGGVYVDTDFECIKPFDVLHRTCEFYTGVAQDNGSLLNGIIGVKKEHLVIKACIDHLTIGNGDHDAWRIMPYTGPHHFTHMFLAHLSECDKERTAIFPPTFFYPFPAKYAAPRNLTEEAAKELFIHPETFAVHYWACSWMK